MAELVFGIASIPGVIDVCVKAGKALFQACDTYREADAALGEMIVRIQMCLARILSQLEVAKELESTLTTEHKDLQKRVLDILLAKLEVITQRVARLTKPTRLGTAKKLKITFLKDALEESIEELESWQRLYEPSWFCWIKLASPAVEIALTNAIHTGPQAASNFNRVARNFRRAFNEPGSESQTVFIRKEGLDGYTETTIPFYSATVAVAPNNSQRLVVDVVASGAGRDKDVRDFARRLRQSDPFVSGLLSCKGVVRHADKAGFSFLFRVPEGYTVIRSLRQLLLSGQMHHSLSDRFEMARQLANAVYYVHLYGFVHKNIRPETILCLGKTDEGGLPSTSCLVGFHVIRNADGMTYPVIDRSWETDLYKHPLRQGNHVDYFVMQHDIYSLGVCLLEIGMWEPFVIYDSPEGAAQRSNALCVAKDELEFFDASALKDHLVALSRSSVLTAKMGTKYSKVVEMCLTCLDEGNMYFGDQQEFQDEDGVSVGVRYIEKVLGALNGISL
ncbi:hypothetical protein V8F33_013220 [Rhypophila sp. PSN 637]